MKLRMNAFPLRKARVHEACGPLAAGCAAVAGAQAEQLLWIRERWRPGMIGAAGLSDFMEPAQILIALTRDQSETLGVAEEALRDGCVGMVILELTAPLGLTAGRRLQLAARSGGSTGLCLIPEGMGSPAAETRWRCRAVADGEDSTLQHWDLIKNKSGTVGAWHVRWSRSARRLSMVSPAGE